VDSDNILAVMKNKKTPRLSQVAVLKGIIMINNFSVQIYNLFLVMQAFA
jgi:hypothetical protein